jgi:acetylornithine deacetylase/succinyl-diaminopimelate desuccinylase-like protein
MRDGAIYARGAMDDKGQMLTYLDAIDSIITAEGTLPLNVKLLFEGEEEMGSPNVGRFAQEHRDMLMADVIALSDTTKFTKTLPAIRYGYRGLINMQIEVTGPAFSVHSGMFGGFVRNPAMALARILCHLKDDDSGRITIPGFYDHVRDAEPWERQEVAALPFDDDALRKYLGVDSLAPEKGYTALESMCFRPTLDIGVIWGGYEGEGLKTIIPSKAGVKMSIRLVPDQKAEVIGPVVINYLRSLALPGIRVDITRYYGNDPLLVPTDTPMMAAAKRAIEYGFGRRPALIRTGGTVGAVTALNRQLGIDNILMMGWGNPEDGAHGPNEQFHIEDFSRGTKTVAALLYGLSVLRA